MTLESTQVEHVPVRPSSSQEARKMDLEMAVLMQVCVLFGPYCYVNFCKTRVLGTDGTQGRQGGAC